MKDLLAVLACYGWYVDALKLTPVHQMTQRVDVSSETQAIIEIFSAAYSSFNAELVRAKGRISKEWMNGVPVRRLQASVDRWSLMEDKLLQALTTSSTEVKQSKAFLDASNAASASRVLLGKMYFYSEQDALALAELNASCPTLCRADVVTRVLYTDGWIDCYAILGHLRKKMNQKSLIYSLDNELRRELPWLSVLVKPEADKEAGAFLDALNSITPDQKMPLAIFVRHAWATAESIRHSLNAYTSEFVSAEGKRRQLAVLLSAQEEAEKGIEKYRVESEALRETNGGIPGVDTGTIVDTFEREFRKEITMYTQIMDAAIETGVLTYTQESMEPLYEAIGKSSGENVAKEIEDIHATPTRGFQSRAEIALVFQYLFSRNLQVDEMALHDLDKMSSLKIGPNSLNNQPRETIPPAASNDYDEFSSASSRSKPSTSARGRASKSSKRFSKPPTGTQAGGSGDAEMKSAGTATHVKSNKAKVTVLSSLLRSSVYSLYSSLVAVIVSAAVYFVWSKKKKLRQQPDQKTQTRGKRTFDDLFADETPCLKESAWNKSSPFASSFSQKRNGRNANTLSCTASDNKMPVAPSLSLLKPHKSTDLSQTVREFFRRLSDKASGIKLKLPSLSVIGPSRNAVAFSIGNSSSSSRARSSSAPPESTSFALDPSAIESELYSAVKESHMVSLASACVDSADITAVETAATTGKVDRKKKRKESTAVITDAKLGLLVNPESPSATKALESVSSPMKSSKKAKKLSPRKISKVDSDIDDKVLPPVDSIRTFPSLPEEIVGVATTGHCENRDEKDSESSDEEDGGGQLKASKRSPTSVANAFSVTDSSQLCAVESSSFDDFSVLEALRLEDELEGRVGKESEWVELTGRVGGKSRSRRQNRLVDAPLGISPRLAQQQLWRKLEATKQVNVLHSSSSSSASAHAATKSTKAKVVTRADAQTATQALASALKLKIFQGGAQAHSSSLLKPEVQTGPRPGSSDCKDNAIRGENVGSVWNSRPLLAHLKRSLVPVDEVSQSYNCQSSTDGEENSESLSTSSNELGDECGHYVSGMEYASAGPYGGHLPIVMLSPMYIYGPEDPQSVDENGVPLQLQIPIRPMHAQQPFTHPMMQQPIPVVNTTRPGVARHNNSRYLEHQQGRILHARSRSTPVGAASSVPPAVLSLSMQPDEVHGMIPAPQTYYLSHQGFAVPVPAQMMPMPGGMTPVAQMGPVQDYSFAVSEVSGGDDVGVSIDADVYSAPLSTQQSQQLTPQQYPMTAYPYHFAYYQSAPALPTDPESMSPPGASTSAIMTAFDASSTLTAIRTQIEYYFSDENLCRDTYLRGTMDSRGFVPLGEIFNFRRISKLKPTPHMILEAVQSSPKLDVLESWAVAEISSTGATLSTLLPQDIFDCMVRSAENPEKWLPFIDNPAAAV